MALRYLLRSGLIRGPGPYPLRPNSREYSMLTALLEAKGAWVTPERLAAKIWAHALVEPRNVQQQLRDVAMGLAAFLRRSGYRLEHVWAGPYRVVWQHRAGSEHIRREGRAVPVRPTPTAAKRESMRRAP